ncbi:MAG: MarR family transcriptional regulator [Chloroflexi bacterium]|nr:MAG: MarR family transcriptional regulator [Chloroflexota bacterium]
MRSRPSSLRVRRSPRRDQGSRVFALRLPFIGAEDETRTRRPPLAHSTCPQRGQSGARIGPWTTAHLVRRTRATADGACPAPHDGPTRDRTLFSKSGLTRLIDRMVEAGLVRRLARPGDQRSLHIALTDADGEIPSGATDPRGARQTPLRGIHRGRRSCRGRVSVGADGQCGPSRKRLMTAPSHAEREAAGKY